jgi:hypothetical protein
MSAIGPKQTSPVAPHMSAFRGKSGHADGTAKCLLVTQSGLAAAGNAIIHADHRSAKEHRLEPHLGKRQMRWIATLGSILLVVMSITRLGCDSASGQTADGAAKRFVGMWRLVSITTSGQVNPDRGPHPTGFIVYDSAITDVVW